MKNFRLQHTGYYPYGEPWREPSGQHARLFAGKERVAGLPEGEYDFGPRGYRSTFLLWDTWDVKATDYPQWSPWLYCGANPISRIDPSGMEINMMAICLYDDMVNQTTAQSVINDLNSQTGLRLSLDENYKLQYEKDENGKPLINKTHNKKGKETDAGSKTARNLLMKAIDSKTEISVGHARTNSGTQNDLIGLNYSQIRSLIDGAVGVDGNTLGFGMTFMHEILHTSIFGYKDNHNNYETGAVVDKMNLVRKELNEQGFNYGQRMSYSGIITSDGVVFPFDNYSLKALQDKWPLPKYSFYIKIKN